LAALPYFRSGGLSHMFVVLRKASSETYARGVADSAVAQRGQAVTPQVTK
jgi:hypothetical protein